MLDFVRVSTRSVKRGVIDIYPKFIIRGTSKDLMIRGQDFYAVWNEEEKLWSTSEDDCLYLIDKEVDKFYEENKNSFGDNQIRVLHCWDSDSGVIDKWHKYCQRQMRDHYHPLDEKVIFSNTEVKKEDYVTKKLPYPLKRGSIKGYNELMSTLYSDEERHKIEWAIGSIITGDSKDIQKFLVMYGAPSTGKSTVLDIISWLFEGYVESFSSKALGQANNTFALEPFKNNPLVAIDHEGDLSKINENTRLNALVSHDVMTVNEKFKSAYSSKFNSFLFVASNSPVKITDSRSGLLRRLIDVNPTGNTLPRKQYFADRKLVKFELGAIAYHCKQVYLKDPEAFIDYVPINMMGATNDFYNYMLDMYEIFKENDETTYKSAWEAYNTYCIESKVLYPYSRLKFQEELKNYFKDFKERGISKEGVRVRSLYSGFKREKFEYKSKNNRTYVNKPKQLVLDQTESLLDIYCKDCPAQYASAAETPRYKWDSVHTTLENIDTSKLHYVKLPINHIVIDFDIKDENGNKSYEKNLEAASKWPPTYAELSKGGQGIHLHYIYEGEDPEQLSRIYDTDIEVKVFVGNSSLRRRLSYCNNEPIATISSGLPLQEKKKMNTEAIKTEKGLRVMIAKNLNKEIHGYTKPSMDFIHKILEDAYESGVTYDVRDLRATLIAFASSSTNQSEYCLKLIPKMKLCSKDMEDDTAVNEGMIFAQDSENQQYSSDELVFFDVEVFPNLFVVVWKREKGKPHILINPASAEIENLTHKKLVGFNCRRYDNHIMYGRLMGYDNMQLYLLSQKIINGDRGAFFGNAYDLSYTDIYDFSSKKQGLKKFEIELGIHHQELGLPWDEDVPTEKWDLVAKYCVNDVVATQATFEARKADFIAREILAELAKQRSGSGKVNDTTNSLTTKIIFGTDPHPQDQFVYTDLSTIFPGYEFDAGKSTYMGETVGEGGYVYAEPGMYFGSIITFDIASMHPSSMIALNIFGDKYTQVLKELLDARLYIKHGDFTKAKKLFGGALSGYLNDESQANALAQALKIAINSIYGLTAAKFDNKFRDKRNIDNIVAKRGALFMVNLKHKVQEMGGNVLHIKTDSIKVHNPTEEIVNYILSYGKEFGYTFEVESQYERFCLVNDAVYIAKEQNGDWTATGKQFQVPYVFKKLFSHEPLIFSDYCETKSVTKGDIYLNMKKGDKDDYIFVGRVGQFTPMKEGGILVRKVGEKYHAVTGTKRPNGNPYLWLESETVKSLKLEDNIDSSYYDRLVDEAVKTISEYGDFEVFTTIDLEKVPTTIAGELAGTNADIYVIDEGIMNPPEDKPPWEE